MLELTPGGASLAPTRDSGVGDCDCVGDLGRREFDHLRGHPTLLSGGGKLCELCRTQLAGGFAVEVERCGGMRAQDRCRRHRSDFAFDTQFDRVGFPSVRDDGNDFACLQDLAHRHGDGFSWDFRDICEPAFADLLAAAGFIELDDEIRLVSIEIGGRVVEGEVCILTDAGERNIDWRRFQLVSNLTDHLAGMVFAIEQVIVRDASLMNEFFEEIFTKARRMRDRQPHVFIEVEHFDALPIDVWRRGEGIQKIQLGRSGATTMRARPRSWMAWRKIVEACSAAAMLSDFLSGNIFTTTGPPFGGL